MAATVTTSLAAAAPLDTNLLRQLPIFNSSACTSAPTRASPSLVQVWRNPVLRTSGNAQYRPTSWALLAGNDGAEAHRASDPRFPGRQRIAMNFGGFGLHERTEEGNDGVAAEFSLEGLFLSSDEAVVDEDAIGTDAESLEEEGQRVVYLASWQMKKMIAASKLGAHCVNVEVLAAEVGLESSDVFEWLENAPSKTILLTTTTEGSSYMEDVHILEEAEKPAVYVPPPPIPSRDVTMREKVEDLMYMLKDVMSGPVAEISSDEKKWDTIVKLFYEKVELQNPLLCFRGRDMLVEWVQLLGLSGVAVKLHDIYYENSVKNPYNRWVYAQWTATLTNDLPTSIGQLGLIEWWARCHRPELGNSSGLEKHSEENQSMKPGLQKLLLSGECRFEMDESGQVTNVRTKWYKLAEHGVEDDFMDAKLWLSGILRRGL